MVAEPRLNVTEWCVSRLFRCGCCRASVAVWNIVEIVTKDERTAAESETLRHRYSDPGTDHLDGPGDPAGDWRWEAHGWGRRWGDPGDRRWRHDVWIHLALTNPRRDHAPRDKQDQRLHLKERSAPHQRNQGRRKAHGEQSDHSHSLELSIWSVCASMGTIRETCTTMVLVQWLGGAWTSIFVFLMDVLFLHPAHITLHVKLHPAQMSRD